ncbi:genetic competence negative regulator [Bacillus sp. DTU_2020_1000418_1_SI_GHA_SEK_038]|uniref:genetic competence negative regulator n=1 Tax=Bacillus sp. DTU_2020_1000418_1_SI_GHA_SEK_038 TaxID=3077585 RepID=UPI0028E45C30|nr:genetic competence negative regulator [Bacillus sp. DTU_2020_1000418_1_SI_GHA_SEK_038]WNS74058.1 genetic competence negative regulator [Bacillus sp. DTU_2020_1000418_1_SI_GHA_SEK_038]
MRLERLNYNKIKIFLTQDDLSERGLTKEDIWKDSMKWHQLFHDMLDEASEEFGVDIQGSVAVEIFSMQAQGMIMIVTMEDQNDEELLQDGFIEMQVIMDSSEEIFFELEDFENVIQLAKRLDILNITNASLYAYKNNYYVHLENQNPDDKNKLIAIIAEYGNPSMISIHMVEEYGTEIIKDLAVEKLMQFFQ